MGHRQFRRLLQHVIKWIFSADCQVFVFAQYWVKALSLRNSMMLMIRSLLDGVFKHCISSQRVLRSGIKTSKAGTGIDSIILKRWHRNFLKDALLLNVVRRAGVMEMIFTVEWCLGRTSVPFNLLIYEILDSVQLPFLRFNMTGCGLVNVSKLGFQASNGVWSYGHDLIASGWREWTVRKRH